MENGEIEISSQEVLSSLKDTEPDPSGCSMESLFEEILKDSAHAACTHTHTCNPPGPDLSHTHTCFHVHTKIISSPTDSAAVEKGSSKKRRPSGNREAVRKYREKMKARAASLEDEVAQLREVNEQLMKRLQGLAALEAEVMRLRCLLVDIRRRMEGEIGSFPYQKLVKGSGGCGDLVGATTQVNPPTGGHALDSCDLRCSDQGYCLLPGMQGKGEHEGGGEAVQAFGVCDVEAVQCLGGSSSGAEFLSCGRGNILSAGCASNANGKKGRAYGSFAERLPDSFELT